MLLGYQTGSLLSMGLAARIGWTVEVRRKSFDGGLLAMLNCSQPRKSISACMMKVGVCFGRSRDETQLQCQTQCVEYAVNARARVRVCFSLICRPKCGQDCTF